MESAVLKTEAVVPVTVGQARQWFLELEAHPERYQFETHAGFTFTKGNFGQVGAHFETRERFYGLNLALRFELTEVDDKGVRFRLIRPAFPVWGAFVLEEGPSDTTHLSLVVGGTSRLGERCLRPPAVRDAIQRQIRGEIEHIKASMEGVFQP